MIRAETLSRAYGSVKAVDSVSFEIGHGEIVGLLGHNGAGKTTIMKMLTGYLEPSAGTARVDDLDVCDDRAAVQQQIGYLPENCPLYPEMLVIEHLEYAASLKGIAKDKVAERIRYAVAKTKLADVALQPVSTLSRGYRQRLGVAQAILNSPKILILDEPTNGLDPSQILEMRSLIKELSNTATVLVSTHILQEVQAVCDRVIIINRGKKALDAKMAQLRTANRLSVVTNLAPAAAASIFNETLKLKVLSHTEESGRHTYVLEISRSAAATTGSDRDINATESGGSGSETQLASLAGVDEAVASVARVLVEKGHKIFAIQPEIRDLETIFGEITAGGDKNSESNDVGSAEKTADPNGKELEASSPSGSAADEGKNAEASESSKGGSGTDGNAANSVADAKAADGSGNSAGERATDGKAAERSGAGEKPADESEANKE